MNKNTINTVGNHIERAPEHKEPDGIGHNRLEWYRVLFNHITDAVFVYHPMSDGVTSKFIEVNDEASRMYGYSREEFFHLTPPELNASEKADKVPKRMERLLDQKHILFETIHATKDGRIFPVEIHSHVADLGTRPMIISIVRDITLRKRSEGALKKSEQKYSRIFENTQDVYFEVTLNGIITEISPSIKDISGYRRQELIGQSLFNICADPEESLDLPEIIQEKEIVTDHEVFLEGKDGIRRWGSISAKLEKNELGVPTTIVGSLREIGDRKKIEQALRENEAQMRAILDSSIDRIRYVDKELKIIWANKTIAEALDMRPEDLVGRFCYELLVERDSPCAGCPCVKAGETGRLERTVMQYPRITGLEGESYWDTYSVPLKNDRGDIGGFIQIGRDITDMRQAIDTLKESEETLRAILAASPVGIGLVQERILGRANKAMHEMVGYEEGSLLGKDVKQLYPDTQEYLRAGKALHDGIKEVGVASIETRWKTREGRIIHVYLQESPLDPSDLSKGIIVAAMDITGRKYTEERIRGLNQQLIKAQENELRRISRYLHDFLAQDLSTVKVGCDALLKNIPKVPLDIGLKISEFSKILQGAITVVRDMAYDLRPAILDEMGLLQAIDKQCEEFSEKNDILIDFYSAGMKELRLDSDTQINLYRLVQEALNNVRKHAAASDVTIRLVASFPNIMLRIEDNGKGFDARTRLIDALKEKRMGLRSMEERVALLKGTMTIQSMPMKGTKIIVKVPYKRKKHDPKEKNRDH